MCSSERSFQRTVNSKSFEDEKQQPAPGNLNLHTKGKHSEAAAVAMATAACTDQSPHGSSLITPVSSNIVASAKIMEEFLKEGKLNPKLEPMQK